MKYATIAIALLAASCNNNDEKHEKLPAPAKAPDAAPAKETTLADKLVDAAPMAPTVLKIEGFSTPEAVIYDFSTGMYFVSNINGSPFDKDDNGFISKVSPDGTILDLHFIDGAKDTITLNAPKGMASMMDTLYVADIDTVRMYDIHTGEPKGETLIEGATFLNDIEPDASGKLLLSDSGYKPDGDKFTASGTDAIYELTPDGKVGAVTRDKALLNPNGVEQGNFAVTFGGKQLLKVYPPNPPKVIAELEYGQLDGVVFVDPDRVVISSWECSCLLIGPPKGPFTKLIENLPTPASIGWDPMRKRLLIPLFSENRVEIHPL